MAQEHSKSSESLNARALNDCSTTLSPEQLSLFGQLVAFDYLSNAVRGLYYKNLGVRLTHYRQLSLETLPAEGKKGLSE